MIYLGIDWAEDHHDLCLLSEEGERLATARVPEGVRGLRSIHELVAAQTEDASSVVVGIEIDRGLLVHGLVASGYQVYGINPFAVSRYRDRHATSGAKSDRGDAKILADLVRTDRHNHRPLAGDSDLAEAVKVLARAQQNLLWARQRHVNQLRSALREYLPGRARSLRYESRQSRRVGCPAARTDTRCWCPTHRRPHPRCAAPCGPSAQPRGDRDSDPSRPPRATAPAPAIARSRVRRGYSCNGCPARSVQPPTGTARSRAGCIF